MTTAERQGAAPLRIALVLWNGKVGGAETFSVALARALRAAGIDARLLIIMDAEPLAQRSREAGVPFVELRLKRARRVLWHARRFAQNMATNGTDGAILVAGGFLALALRLGGYRARIVAVEHGALLQAGHMGLATRVLRRIDRASGVHAVDVHVAVSEFLRGHIMGGSRPVVTIPNGIDLHVYRPLASSRFGEEFVIGCMSRLIVGKGVEDVLEAARKIVRRGARLRIAGDGPERSRLELLAEQLGIQEHVEFAGWIQEESDVAAFWSGCDVAVAAPNDWIESFGLAAVEAMACGVPVVATRGGALAETVVHERTGFLVEPRDTDALAGALLAYLDDASLATAHGAAARQWCEQRFDIQRCADAYARLFRDVTPGPPRDETADVARAPEEETSALGPWFAP